jgi:hypothetical protein
VRLDLAPRQRHRTAKEPDAIPLKRKAALLHGEFMFTRSLFGTQDMIAQHRLLNEVSGLVDAGVTFVIRDRKIVAQTFAAQLEGK